MKEYLARKEAEEIMTEVFEKEESMKLWEKDLKEEGRAGLIYEMIQAGKISKEEGATWLGQSMAQLSENMASYKA